MSYLYFLNSVYFLYKMKKRLNNELISALTNYIPDGDSVVNLVSEILSMGKESVYRRLRGEVLFTFEEVAMISKKLNISLDNIIGFRNVKRAVFDLRLLQKDSLYDEYYEQIADYVRIFQGMKKDPVSKMRIAFNALPLSFCLRYENLAKFRLFRWANQFQQYNQSVSFSTMQLPDRIVEIQNQFLAESQHIASAHYLLDDNVFASFIRDVRYFAKMRLITEDEILVLKNELLALMNDIEALAIRGASAVGNEVLIYLSQIDFKASYAYLECKDYTMCDLRVYAVNAISSCNTQVCQVQRDWIESLKRYSTLITQSGEIQRADYLDRQREYIMNS